MLTEDKDLAQGDFDHTQLEAVEKLRDLGLRHMQKCHEAGLRVALPASSEADRLLCLPMDQSPRSF